MPGSLVLAFGVVLVIGVLISERVSRTVLSTSVLFLAAGFLLGRGALGWVDLAADDDMLRPFAELALIAILFVDGARLPCGELRRAWGLPGRALLLGMPLTMGAIAVAGHLVLGMTWIEAFLVGAILSPTDPVLVASILEHEAVPLRLRRLLGIESGLNDGLALPVVMVLVAVAGHREPQLAQVLLETGLGVGLGVAIPAGVLWLEGRRIFAVVAGYRPLVGVAIAAMIVGASLLLHANEFLGVYAGGVTLVTLRPELASSVREVGVHLAELVKLATLLLFGALLSVPFLLATGWAGAAFALVALLAARPLALVLALLGGGLPRSEWLAAAWFGPKGFASLLYAILVLNAGLPRGTWLVQATALVIVVSIVAHSSTDTLVARWFHRAAARARAADAA